MEGTNTRDYLGTLKISFNVINSRKRKTCSKLHPRSWSGSSSRSTWSWSSGPIWSWSSRPIWFWSTFWSFPFRWTRSSSSRSIWALRENRKHLVFVSTAGKYFYCLYQGISKYLYNSRPEQSKLLGFYSAKLSRVRTFYYFAIRFRKKQECISVGCVLPASMVISRGVYLWSQDTSLARHPPGRRPLPSVCWIHIPSP